MEKLIFIFHSSEGVHILMLRNGKAFGICTNIESVWDSIKRKLDMLWMRYEKAVVLLSKSEGIFAWAPSLREWLKNPDYVFWLGAGGLRIGT